ncbi:MAG: polysaccharide deacetylase family protein [Eggerthellaceae bacterium]|nr:polysaccharide deacetylase family protein [Eggerthellaceae bacterium]
MAKKYFTWSFDDGLEQDKRIVDVLRKNGMGATFHLNSGLFGDKTYEGRIGNLGMTEAPAIRFDPRKHHLLRYVEHFRIPANEVVDVYRGFEIASHTVSHANLARCTEEERTREIADDVRALSSMFGQAVIGFAFPYGAGAKKSRPALEAAGVRYARLATSAGGAAGFRFPRDPLAMPLTCWHISKKTFATLQAFFDARAEDDDLFFLMFAHGYEFDFSTHHSNWTRFERICDAVASHDDIECCSIGEALARHGQI